MTEPPQYPQPGNTPGQNGPDPNDPLRKNEPGADGPTPPPYGAQPEYGAQQPQYGTPQYGSPQYGAPQYGSPQYGAPEYGTPQPGFGDPGAPPPPGAYPGQPGYDQGAFGPGGGVSSAGVNIGEAMSWAWAKFRQSPVPMLLPGLLVLLATALFIGVFFSIMSSAVETTTTTTYFGGTTTSDTISLSGGSVFGLILVSVLFFVAMIYLSASMTSGALRVANGEPVSMKTFLVPQRLGAVVITSLIVGVITSIGLALCVIPGLIAIFLLQFAVFIVIDKPKVSAFGSLGESSRLARSSVVNSILTLLVSYALSYVGTLLFYIGLIVTWPIGQLFYAHCYRRLSGGYIAPAQS